jgi:predicted nucleic acid-binding OB-fold protein
VLFRVNFYYLYKDLCLYTKNNLKNAIAKVITIKNNKLIIQFNNSNNSNGNDNHNNKQYIYLSRK